MSESRKAGDGPPSSVTAALAELAHGAPEARNHLVDLIYGELKQLASRAMQGQRLHHTLQPTALVHEAYLRLIGGVSASWENRVHFLAAAARAMRSVLVDHARRHQARKRGAEWERVPLNEEIDGTEELSTQILEVHEVLDRLGERHSRKQQIVELLFFGGLTVDEAGAVLGISGRMVKKEWRFARAWLFREISRER